MANTKHDVDVNEQAGYWELVSGNVNFRRLWAGNIISLLGDWFNTIALYTLVSQLTGSPLAMGIVFLTKMLPWAVFAPLAGTLVDRFNRRRLMIVSDVLRAIVVLGFLTIDTAEEIPLLYFLIAAQVIVGSVFQPAKSASLPNITTPRELLTANALMSATWSTMLALGAALGGLAAEAFGVEAVFWIDSASYLVSAFFIARTTIPQDTDPPEKSLLRSAAHEIRDGWRHLRAHPRIGRISLAKATWATGGGALVYMLTLLGDRVAPSALAAGIGVLFMARGIGTGIGPVLVRAIFKDETKWPAVLGGAIIVSGLCYAVVGFLPWSATTQGIVVLCVFVVASHAASGGNWVLASVMLQKRTDDRYRGRVFSTEWLFVMLAESVSIFAASVLLEQEILTLETAFQTFAGFQILCGLAFLAYVVPRERRDDEQDASAKEQESSLEAAPASSS